MHDIKLVKSQMRIVHGDVYGLAGHANRWVRQTLMLNITGEHLPLSRCGVNAIHAALKARIKFTPGCLAEESARILMWSREHTTNVAAS